MAEPTGSNREERQYCGIVLLFQHIGYSREPIPVIVRYYLVFVAAVAGIAHMLQWWQSFSVPNIFRKDIMQEYLISKSVLGGVDPYLPIQILADRFMGPLPTMVFQHPTPYPPPVVLFCLPLGWLSYGHFAIVWFFFELICLAVSVALLLWWLGAEKRMVLGLLSALLILAWAPITSELVLGQLNALLFVLLVGAWQALRSGKHIQGGILLGSAIAVKLVPWPIMIFLMLRRYWRATCAAVTTIAIANVAATTLIGLDRMTHYYLKIGMSVSSLHHAHISNFSLWTIGWRIFDATGSPVLSGVNVPPLFSAPAIAPFTSIAIPFAMLILGLLFALRVRTLDTSFGILICLMILVSPVAWDHYLIPVLIPIGIAVRNLSSLDWPRKETNIGLCIGLTFFLSTAFSSPRLWISLLGYNGFANRLGPTVSSTVSLLSLLPAMGLLGLLLLLRRLDSLAP